MWIEYIKTLAFALPIIKEKIYPLDDFQSDVEVDVRRAEPITFYLTSRIPTADIYFKINNKSQYLDAKVEAIKYELWLQIEGDGTERLFPQDQIVSGEVVKAKQTINLSRLKELNTAQIEILRTAKQNGKDVKADLTTNLIISSKLYCFVKQENLRSISCRIMA